MDVRFDSHTCSLVTSRERPSVSVEGMVSDLKALAVFTSCPVFLQACIYLAIREGGNPLQVKLHYIVKYYVRHPFSLS